MQRFRTFFFSSLFNRDLYSSSPLEFDWQPKTDHRCSCKWSFFLLSLSAGPVMDKWLGADGGLRIAGTGSSGPECGAR